MSMNLNAIDFSDAVDFDIRDLSHATDSVKVGDGTNFLAVDASGNIGVTDAGGSLTVDATDLDIRDLTSASDSVRADLADGAGTALTSTLVGADQALDVNVVALTAADVDIRDLTHVSDSVKIGDGTDFLAIAADGSIAVTDNGGSLTVDATDLDIRDLTAASDSVESWTHDGSGNAIGSTSGALDVNISSSDISLDVEEEANTAIENTAYSASTTGADMLGGSQLANRKYYMAQNLGSQDVFVGKSGVTTSNGLRLFKNNTLELRLGPALALHGVTASGTADVRIMELS